MCYFIINSGSQSAQKLLFCGVVGMHLMILAQHHHFNISSLSCMFWILFLLPSAPEKFIWDSLEPRERLSQLSTLPISRDKWYYLIFHTWIQILELSGNNANLRKHIEEETKKKKIWKLLIAFIQGARAFHGSI